jgi:hypothetical protein
MLFQVTKLQYHIPYSKLSMERESVSSAVGTLLSRPAAARLTAEGRPGQLHGSRTGSPVLTRCAIGSGDGFSLNGSASAASGGVTERRFPLAADSTPRRGDRRSWSEIWKQSSPRRGEGTPLHGRSESWAGAPGLNSIGTRRGPRIEGHVASEDSKRNRALDR